MDTEYLTVEDLKKLFRIGNDKAYKLCETRGFPSFRIGEGRWLIDQAKLREWVEKLEKTKTKSFSMNFAVSFPTSEYSTAELFEIYKLLKPDEQGDESC